jgi:nucleoside-diphosphate-sugar epimerase
LSRRECDHVQQSIAIDLAADGATSGLRTLRDDSGAPDVFIHAASAQPGTARLSDFVRSNVLTTGNVWDALRETPPRQVIFTSTLSVYQTPGCPDEEAPSAGVLPYSATKRWAEQICTLFSAKSQVTILRLPSLYGAGQADSFIDGLGRQAMQNQPLEVFGRGQTVRDALHVDDVVQAIANCVERPPVESPCIMNLGVGRPIRTIEYIQALVAALGSSSEIVLLDRAAAHIDLCADITKAQRLIGFSATALPESMQRYANELRT